MRASRPILAPDVVPTDGMKFASGMVRKRSLVLIAPLWVKSCGLRLVTGTPTAAVPRISDPVTSTCSGTVVGAACAVIGMGCACAAPEFAIASSDADPSNDAIVEVLGFIAFPLWRRFAQLQ